MTQWRCARTSPGADNFMHWSELTLQLIRAARDEDLGEHGDITSALVAAPDETVTGRIVSRAAGVAACLTLGPMICTEFSVSLRSAIRFAPVESVRDGDAIQAGQTIAVVQGGRRAVLTAERTLLNFLCRACGVATLTRRYVETARAGNPRVQVLDTRKTLPGWREIDKCAVRCGGGANHRFGLFDAILIKDNHLAGIPADRLADTVAGMLARKKPEWGPLEFVEIEVDSLDQLSEIAKVPGVDTILLDNFNYAQLQEAVALRDRLGLGGKVKLEASGGVSLATIGEIAATGVDRISVGALTHSATALDLGLDF